MAPNSVAQTASAERRGLRSLARGDSVRVESCDVEVTVVDRISGWFGGAGVVGIDNRDRRWLLAREERGVRVAAWRRGTYRTVLVGGRLEGERVVGGERVESGELVADLYRGER